MKRDARAPLIVAIALLLLLVPVLYVLSIGPACWLAYNDCISREAVTWLYSPVLNYAKQNRGAVEWLACYLELFKP